MSGIEAIKSIIFWLAKYDIWSSASFVILIFGLVAGYIKFYRPHKSIKNFYVFFHCECAAGWDFPFRVIIGFTNHTGRSVHIASASFKFKNLRPDPNSTVDSSTGRTIIKFPTEVMVGEKIETLLQDFEYYLKVDETVHSYAPIDPSHKNEEAEQAFSKGKVGTLDCYVTLLSRDRKPIVYRLKTSPKKRLTVRVSPKKESSIREAQTSTDTQA